MGSGHEDSEGAVFHIARKAREMTCAARPRWRWGGPNPPCRGSCAETPCPVAALRRSTPPEPINGADGVYRAARKGEDLWRYLTRRHKRRRPRRARPSRDRIKDRASIHDRPRDVEGRADIGHWEGDLIICKRTRPVLVLHERKSRVTLATRLAGKSA